MAIAQFRRLLEEKHNSDAMDIWEWVDKKEVQTIATSAVIGLCAALVRAMSLREKIKPFLIRLISGMIMSGLTAYLIGDLNLPNIVFGVINFTAGWTGAEFGMLLNRIGKSSAERILSNKQNNNDEYESGD